MLISILIILASLIFDQGTKIIFELNFFEGEVLDLIPNLLYLTKEYNTGGAWSMLNNNTTLLATISLAAAIIFGYFIYKKSDFKTKKIFSISLCLILGGTVGNMIDRFMFVFGARKGVVDFIGVYIFGYRFPIFNVADMCLVIGMILLCVDILFLEEKRKKKMIEEETSEEKQEEEQQDE